MERNQKITKKRKKTYKLKCAVCDKEFTSYKPFTLCCSERCRRKRRYMLTYEKTYRKCVICGDRFIPNHIFHRVCSDKCLEQWDKIKEDNPLDAHLIKDSAGNPDFKLEELAIMRERIRLGLDGSERDGE